MDKQLPKQIVKYIINHKGYRQEVHRRCFFRFARQYTPYLASNIGERLYYVSTADHAIGCETFLYGGFDDRFTQTLFRVLKNLGQADFHEKTFVDIGANIGTSCIPAVTQYGFARAIAFEPGPDNFRLLKQNLMNNRVEDRIQAWNIALSDRESSATLEINAISPGTHYIRVEGGDPTYVDPNAATISVQASTFDSFVQRGVIDLSQVGLVWMDTEGHEGQIFQGAQSLLETAIPVFIEYSPAALQRAGGLEILNELIATRYTHFVDIRKADLTGQETLQAAGEVHALKNLYPGLGLTDLLLLKR